MAPICLSWFVIRFFDEEGTLRALIPIRQEDDYFYMEDTIKEIRMQIGGDLDIDIVPSSSRNLHI